MLHLLPSCSLLCALSTCLLHFAPPLVQRATAGWHGFLHLIKLCPLWDFRVMWEPGQLCNVICLGGLLGFLFCKHQAKPESPLPEALSCCMFVNLSHDSSDIQFDLISCWRYRFFSIVFLSVNNYFNEWGNATKRDKEKKKLLSHQLTDVTARRFLGDTSNFLQDGQEFISLPVEYSCAFRTPCLESWLIHLRPLGHNRQEGLRFLEL
jgi:hypothetical protein